MKTLSIVYFSGTGHTKLIAEALGGGALDIPGVTVTLHPILGEHIVEGRYTHTELFDELAASDAIVFGSPTYMGNVAAQFKAFADASAGVWFARGWKDKIAGGFTGSGGLSGDKLATLQTLAVLAAQHSMHWVNAGELPSYYLGLTDGMNRLGSFLGVMAKNDSPQGETALLDAGDQLTAATYGRRIAEVTRKFA